MISSHILFRTLHLRLTIFTREAGKVNGVHVVLSNFNYIVLCLFLEPKSIHNGQLRGKVFKNFFFFKHDFQKKKKTGTNHSVTRGIFHCRYVSLVSSFRNVSEAFVTVLSMSLCQISPLLML